LCVSLSVANAAVLNECGAAHSLQGWDYQYMRFVNTDSPEGLCLTTQLAWA
jgi:hypothetical protein